MKWFGDDWVAPICKELEQVPVPVGEKCFSCEGDFIEHDRGLVLPFQSAKGVQDSFWHLVCFSKSITGK